MKLSKIKPEQQQEKAVEKVTDQRFQNPQFRMAVKTVLEYLGLESNIGNFKRHDRLINWLEFARNIQGKNTEQDYIDYDKFCKSCEEIERGKYENQSAVV